MSDRPHNPLLHATGENWNRLIASINPPAMLVTIESMMGTALRERMSADDVWQETLLHAWRDRAKCEWRGTAAFRRWLIEVARNRVHDLADVQNAQKRGADRVVLFTDRAVGSGSQNDDHYAGPCSHTTPGRAAADRETANMFSDALAGVPEECRAVVRLRLFEEMPLEDIAQRLGLGVEGVRYRFRHGSEAYVRELLRRRAIGSTTPTRDT